MNNDFMVSRIPPQDNRSHHFVGGGTPYPSRKIILMIDDGEMGTTKEYPLPTFGEVKIITHGRDTRVETTVKEKVE